MTEYAVAASLAAGMSPVSAGQMTYPFELATDQIRARFEASPFGGSLALIQQGPVAQRFQPSALYTLLVSDGEAIRSYEPDGSLVGNYTRQGTAQAVEWVASHHVDTPAGKRHVDVHLLTLLQDGDPTFYWSASLEVKSGQLPRLTSIRFPNVVLSAADEPPGAAPILISGVNGGSIVNDPYDFLYDRTRALDGGEVHVPMSFTYPGVQQLSFYAVVDTKVRKGGLYLDLADDKSKPPNVDYFYLGEAGVLQVSVQIEAEPFTGTWRSPYLVRTRILPSQPEPCWYNAVETYRRNTAVQALIQGTPDKDRIKAIDDRIKVFQMFGPTLWGDYAQPDAAQELSYIYDIFGPTKLNLPPTMAYHQIEREATNPQVRIQARDQGLILGLYNDGPFVKFDDEAAFERYQDDLVVAESGDYYAETFGYLLEMDQEPFLDDRIDSVSDQVAFGISAIYQDLFPRFGQSCYSTIHGHPSGASSATAVSYSNYVNRLREETFPELDDQPVLVLAEYFQEYLHTDLQGLKSLRNYLPMRDPRRPDQYLMTATFPGVRAVYGETTILGDLPPPWAYDSQKLWELMAINCPPNPSDNRWLRLHQLTRAEWGYLILSGTKPFNLTGNNEGSMWDADYDLTAAVHNGRDYSSFDQRGYREFYRQATALYRDDLMARRFNYGMMCRPPAILADARTIPNEQSRLAHHDTSEWTVPFRDPTPYVIGTCYGDGTGGFFLVYNWMDGSQPYSIELSPDSLPSPPGSYSLYQGDWTDTDGDGRKDAFAEVYLGRMASGTSYDLKAQLESNRFRFYRFARL